jgi:long-chain acyl-CoA synthetase
VPSPTRASLADTEEVVPRLFQQMLGADEQTVFLCPAPLYHSAPLNCTMAMQRIGATSVVMRSFTAEGALSAIQAYGVTHVQFVPTHFVRMLKLPEETRRTYRVSTLRTVIHSAAPCPVPVKKQMLDWWGPIVHEYYAGSESNGGTFITAEEWLKRPGSVGKALFGRVHICDEYGHERPARSEGLVYFEGGREFSYRNDPKKTRESRNRYGWTTMGDIGWQDEEGYLYLTDRQSFMIISGGVNVYPQEIENHLVTHPDVLDVAVIGAPDADMGERVIAVVQPRSMERANDDLAQQLTAYCRSRLSGIKVPRQIDFAAELPRTETGKLLKRLLRDRYWKGQANLTSGS